MVAYRGDARHDARARRLAVVRVVRHQQADLEKARVGVAQPGDALARRQLSLLVLFGDLVGPAPVPQLRFERADLGAQLTQTRGHTSCRSRSLNHSRM